ncbi:MAG TPA: response regulator [Puia sp.]|nr:response regulator [Puia sp.]
MMKKKVLLVDDENDFGLLLKSYFSKRGFEVFLSQTLTEGMRTLERIKPDILILDNNLPDGMGWEKTAYVLEKNAGIQLILISAYHHDSSISLKFPSVKILEKPVSLSELNNFLS